MTIAVSNDFEDGSQCVGARFRQVGDEGAAQFVRGFEVGGSEGGQRQAGSEVTGVSVAGLAQEYPSGGEGCEELRAVGLEVSAPQRCGVPYVDDVFDGARGRALRLVKSGISGEAEGGGGEYEVEGRTK